MFAILYSLGNICTLISYAFFEAFLTFSTGFLIGPLRQLQQMIDPNRLVATIVFFAALAVTLVVALMVCLSHAIPLTSKWGDYLWAKILCILLVIIQALAFIWYSISYIPFARDFVKSVLGNLCFD